MRHASCFQIVPEIARSECHQKWNIAGLHDVFTQFAVPGLDSVGMLSSRFALVVPFGLAFGVMRVCHEPHAILDE